MSLLALLSQGSHPKLFRPQICRPLVGHGGDPEAESDGFNMETDWILSQSAHCAEISFSLLSITCREASGCRKTWVETPRLTDIDYRNDQVDHRK